MVPIWLGKMVAKGIIKGVKHRIDLKKIDKYVNKPNELDIQIKQQQKIISKQGRYIEELEKDVAILKKDSHPPMFAKDDYKKIIKRLNKLEKRR
jgi:tRNA U34 5-carboxymethylaminomethyl modifying enzyme MnmG/GidA